MKTEKPTSNRKRLSRLNIVVDIVGDDPGGKRKESMEASLTENIFDQLSKEAVDDKEVSTKVG